MGARLTFSGVAWDGTGRIDGDSLRLDMSIAGSPPATSVWVARAVDANTIRLQGRPVAATALDLTLVREH